MDELERHAIRLFLTSHAVGPISLGGLKNLVDFLSDLA
jgi:hypothetical protein